MPALALRRVELAISVLVPAVIAGALVLLLAPVLRAGGEQLPTRRAAHLAHLAELRPIVVHGERTVLGTGPAGPMASGARAAAPSSLAIPSLHVDTDIDPVTATAEGIEVPEIGRAGWFDAGPRPGEPGRSVIIGHLDGATEPGVFQHVPEIENGAEIVVRDEAGKAHAYEVVGKTQVAKSQFPAREVYGPSESPVLVLVTCGGGYDPAVGYTDNVIVYARALRSA